MAVMTPGATPPEIRALAHYRRFYEQDAVRKEHVPSEERVGLALQLVPAGYHSLLDAGCGDGTLLGMLDGDFLKVGLDISLNALRRAASGEVLAGDCGRLPFRTQVFDLVLCTEVLEHLPKADFQRTIIELSRVARHAILISVPFTEDLQRRQARCPGCGFVYHIQLHLRRFSDRDLPGLFPGFELKKRLFSNTTDKTHPRVVTCLRRKLGNRWEWSPAQLCPRCGLKDSRPPRRSSVSVVTTLLAELLGRRHPKWVACWYERL